MTQRILRTVPMAVLMTTAMAWNLPARAQAGPGTAPPPAVSTGSAQPTMSSIGIPVHRAEPKPPAATAGQRDERQPADGAAQPASMPDKTRPADGASDRQGAAPAAKKP